MKRMRRVVGGALAAVMLVGSTVSVNAADLKDVFDAEYYAEQYPDLKAAFGNDEKALYQHFLKYGLKEGRVMNPIIDVVKYREQYGDLQTAFGDNWDAYVEHFFTFGVNEKRDGGTDFDMNAYLESYADLKTAFGSDYLSAAKHYMTTGVKENRQEASKEYVRAREEAAKEAEEETESEIETGEFYDENGRTIKRIYWSERRNAYNVIEWEYDENGLISKRTDTDYGADSPWNVETWVNGKIRERVYYGANHKTVYEYDENENQTRTVHYYGDTIGVTTFTGTPVRPDWYELYDLDWNFQCKYKMKADSEAYSYFADYSVKYDADGNVME